MDRSDSPATFGHLSRFRFGFPTCVDLLKIGQELFGVSQVPEASLITCHSLMTPAAFHDLANCGRFLLTSRPFKRSSTATILDFGAVPAIQGVRLPLWPTTFSVYASPVLFPTPCRLSSAQALRHRRNTRYGWVANPCPTGTCTLQDAPSFAWRNNTFWVTGRDEMARLTVTFKGIAHL
jgi:hypothetical protein